MTITPSTKAMLKYMLSGKAINIKSCFINFGFSNPAREMARKIEQKFNLNLVRTKKIFKSRYGISGYYYDYTLSKSDYKKVRQILDAEKKANKKK